ncbi:MAG: PIG-L family deacetylase [Dehalococcoidia bacterium]|nr:PIG-L family deacetylase [Dehalococcoidia bacterium]
MLSVKTIIFFGAHPDDESFGLGGTLARYALAGVKVYYACATRGEAGTVDNKYLQGRVAYEVRLAEMACAADALSLAGVVYLGYRDSGMRGAAENEHPEALMRAPMEEVAKRMVKVMRELKPDVVITHDAGGGYGHPDHIAVHQAVVRAFELAPNPQCYPEAGPPFQAAKLYFSVRPVGFMKLAVRLMPLFGQDPRRFGRNKDIDLTQIMSAEYPVNAVVRFDRVAMKKRDEASACHASQGGGRSRSGIFRLFGFFENLRGPRDYFMRAYPPPGKKREKDLLEGLA